MLEDAKLLDEDFDGGGSRSWGTAMTVGGVNYATSLFWQPLQNSNDYMAEVEEAASSVLEGADLFCIKGGKTPQFGICASHEGYKSGENVAAVALATALSNVSSFVAVFKVNGGWWYTCVRNDIILSDGDMFYLSEEEAKNQFFSMMAVPDWSKKIAPPEWEFEDTEYFDLEELLQRGAKAKLQKIKGLRGSRLLMVVAISAVVGLWLISSLVDKLFLTPVKRPVVVPVRPKVVQPVVEVPEVPKPWESLKNPTQFMETCYKGIKDLAAIMPPGWNIGLISCTDGAAVTSWTRDFSPLSVAEEALTKSGLQFAGYSFDASGTSLSASLPLDIVETLSSPPDKTAYDLRNELNNLFQTLGLTINLSDGVIQTVPPEPVGQKGPGAPQPAPSQTFRFLNFSISSTHNPLTWIGLLTKYSGLEVTMITYSPSDGNWHYEGTIYVL